jgi:hypothetical protein
VHRTATLVLSAALVVLGVLMAATAVAGGGGPLATGVVLGALFVAAGALRLWAAR